ncbi:MAG: hypothetical protein ABH824_03165 [Nanoarchaeota archaeon]|nr:hypothetical protein [Nanoarchaeota archaeon]MBU1632430.1 hypothetical protein [Nanoarchaeota archaeon]MBU1875912.1 hypothetical protein [Nanoarchaeota archaeon]
MPTLIACLSSGKGTWTEVIKIIQSQSWDKVFLITNEFGKDNFRPPQNTELIVINDYGKDTSQLAEQIKSGLKSKIKDFEIALNFSSGSGKEHMALLETVLELGFNFRLVTINNNQLEIMGINR